MKRIMYFAATALVALVSCANRPSLEQRIADYEKFMEEVETIEEFAAHSLDIVKENGDNELGLTAAVNLWRYGSPVQADEALSYLSEELKSEDMAQQMIQSLTAYRRTAEGQKFTDFEVNGVKFSDFIGKGKYVLVDFWASWCGPCKAELPNIAAIYDQYAGEQFDVLSVAVWDKPEDTRRAAAELGIKWSQIIDAQQVPTELYGIDGIPHIILFGPDGTILRRNLRGEAIGAAVKQALGR